VDNVSELEHGEDISQVKQSCTSKDMKAWYALRLKRKDSKAVASQKNGDVTSHSIVVGGSNSDSDSCNSNKSQKDMKHNLVEKMADLSKKAGRSLPSCPVGASNGNAEADVGISEGISETEADA